MSDNIGFKIGVDTNYLYIHACRLMSGTIPKNQYVGICSYIW